MKWIDQLKRISSGPMSVKPPQPQQRAGIVTSAATRQSRRTDPRLWTYQHVDMSSFEEAQPFDVDATVAGWITQSNRDHSGRTLHRYISEYIGPTEVYVDMKDLGRTVRRRACTKLNLEYGYQQAFDPDQESNYSPASIIRMVCRLHHIDLIPMQEQHKLIAAKWGTPESPVYAFLRTGTMRAPLLAYDPHPYGVDTGPYTDPALDNNLWQRNTTMWSFHAGCCLAKFLYDQQIYGGGRGSVPEIVAPFNPQTHATFLPLAHIFAKTLLGIKDPCPSKWPCACNYIDDLLTQRPASHPQQTGVLPVGTAWTPQPTTGDFGGYASPSRTLTPPNGIPGERLREYRRRTTDPNLRRETGG